MSAKILLMLTLIFVAASTGHGYTRHGKPQIQLDTSTFKAPLASISATNGSTIEEIMRELDMNTRIQQSGCHFSAGTYGGGGGGSFNELPDNCGAVVRKIYIRSGSRLDSIQVVYRLSDGRDYTAGKHGGNGGGSATVDINVGGGERLVGVFGRSGGSVDQIGFVTNKGRIFGPYGGCGGGPFRVNSCLLRGIFGRSGSRIDSIGFHCSNV